MIEDKPSKEIEFLLEGPAGALELICSEPKQAKKLAVICHPHPQYGGSLRNKVVTTLHKAFQELSMVTLRFNYRGVGKSAGVYDEGRGEKADTLAVLAWAQSQYPNFDIYLAGFSFGAYISYSVATDSYYRDKLAQLVSITMPQYPGLAELAEPACPWLLIQGLEDEVVEAQGVFDWVSGLIDPPRLITLPDTGHFFHGKLVELRKILVENLDKGNS